MDGAFDQPIPHIHGYHIYIYIILFIAIRLLDGHIPDELTFISPSKFGHSDQKKDKKNN